MPKNVDVTKDKMQEVAYLLRKRHLGAVETAWLDFSKGFIQGALFARICVEAEALQKCQILR